MVMMMVLVLFLIVIIVVMMVMMMVLVLFFLFLLLAHELLEDLSLQIGSAFDSSEDLFAVQFSKRGRDDRCLRIVFAKDLYALSDLFLTCLVGSCEDDRACALDLVDKELAEVLHIKLALGSVHNRYGGIEGHIGAFGCILHRFHDIRQFSYSGGFDQDPLRGVLVHNLPQGCSEITYQRAADASGIHLTDLNSRFLEKTAVNTDLAELVLDQHDACACKRLFDQLLDQRCLAGSQETGHNINFRHYISLPF